MVSPEPVSETLQIGIYLFIQYVKIISIEIYGCVVGEYVPGRGGDVVGVDCVFNLAGGPATALLTGADRCADFASGVAVVNTPRPFLLTRLCYESDVVGRCWSGCW